MFVLVVNCIEKLTTSTNHFGKAGLHAQVTEVAFQSSVEYLQNTVKSQSNAVTVTYTAYTYTHYST